MDNTYVSALAEVGVSLTTLAVKGTATAINTKIKAILLKMKKIPKRFEIPMMKLSTNFYQNARKRLELLKRINPNSIEL